MGKILFNDVYNPQVDGTTKKQSINVTLPNDFAIGPAQLNVAHMALIGVSNLRRRSSSL
jgi:hypothetical protein